MKLVCLFFLIITLNIQAQEPEQQSELDFEQLTLDQALTYALEHSPAIKEAKITVALAELDLKQTKWWNWFVPNLTLHQGYNPVLAENRMGVGISFDINKIIGGGYNQSKQARLKLFDAEIYLTNSKQAIIADVTKS